MHPVDVGLPPAHYVGDLVIGRGVDGGVEDHVDPTFLSDHVGAVLPQLVQLVLVFALPVRPVLVTIDVDGKPCQPRCFQLLQDLWLQGHRVSQNNRLDVVLGDEGYNVYDIRVDQRLATSNGDIIGVTPLFEEEYLFFDFFQ